LSIKFLPREKLREDAFVCPSSCGQFELPGEAATGNLRSRFGDEPAACYRTDFYL
jgi:hypothetical protein